MVSKENGLELKRILPAENAIGNFPRWTVLCFTLQFFSLSLKSSSTIQSVTNLVGPHSNPWFPFSVDHLNFFFVSNNNTCFQQTLCFPVSVILSQKIEQRGNGTQPNTEQTSLSVPKTKQWHWPIKSYKSATNWRQFKWPPCLKGTLRFPKLQNAFLILYPTF